MDFLRVSDLDREEIYAVLDRAEELRSRWRRNDMPRTLKNQRIALWFYGQGFRNRVAADSRAPVINARTTFNHPYEIIGDLQFIYSKRKTVDNLNVVFVGETTDCWPKGGDAAEVSRLFMPYQITKSIVAKMNPRGFYMPCPPITRGEEISADSISAEQYCDYEAKEFLLHSQNAIMEYCIR